MPTKRERGQGRGWRGGGQGDGDGDGDGGHDVERITAWRVEVEEPLRSVDGKEYRVRSGARPGAQGLAVCAWEGGAAHTCEWRGNERVVKGGGGSWTCTAPVAHGASRQRGPRRARGAPPGWGRGLGWCWVPGKTTECAGGCLAALSLYRRPCTCAPVRLRVRMPPACAHRRSNGATTRSRRRRGSPARTCTATASPC